MVKVATEDTITQQIPSHIIEKYPHFVEFLKAYYEWLNQPGNPYERIKNHLDYLNFEKSLDEYTNFMKAEYLSKIPLSIIGDKQKFIEWSRKLGLSRGSHESFKFLFRMLFGEQTTEIYLPKDNILKPSDGKWINDQSVILVTNTGNPDRFAYKRIRQEREIFPGVFEVAEATVDSSYVIRYSNSFNVVEFTLTDIVGEFKPGYKVFDTDGNSEWPITTIIDFDITNGGQDYFKSDRVFLDGFTSEYEVTYTAIEDGHIDTRITTTLQKDQIYIEVDGNILDPEDYSYDGQFITSSLINIGSSVLFRSNISYQGSMFVSKIGPNGEVENINVSTTPIAIQGQDFPITITSSFGTGIQAVAKTGLVRKIPGYYVGQKGQLSSNMYLQDSDYYQDYSYEIRTERNIQEYAQIVKDVLHPAGFKLFGNVRLLYLIEILVGIVEDDSGAFAQIFRHYGLNKWGIGPKYLWYAKNAGYLSPRVYKGTEWDNNYVNGDVGYDLSDKYLERTYDFNHNQLQVQFKGWMTKNLLTDSDIRQPNDYFEHNAFYGLYMEDSYVLGGMDETSFINTYINRYGSQDYVEEDYWE